MYWTTIFPDVAKDKDYWKTNSLFNEIELHGFIIVILGLEYFFDSLQVYKSHVVFMLIYASLYIIMNIFVTLQVRVIYAIMTWRDYESVLWATLTLILFLVSFYLLVWIGKNKRGVSDNDDDERYNLRDEEIDRKSD